MKKSKVSIIIPVYNVEAYLPACLDAILAQTFGEWEAVCVNDGSTDTSEKILKKYAQKDPRIKVISQQNQGVSAARNTALNAANGNYICFIDADDEVAPTFLEKLYQCPRKYLEALYIYIYIYLLIKYIFFGYSRNFSKIFLHLKMFIF